MTLAEKKKMQIVCFKCKELLGEIEGSGDGGVSHGLCPNCRKIESEEIAKDREILRRIHESMGRR
jgi:hypothetical protein